MASNNVASEVNAAITNLNGHLATALAGTGDDVSVITLAGENNGAAMEAAAGGDAEDLVVVEAGGGEEEEVEVSAYTNSNYQAVNNSVLVAGSCAVRDPACTSSSSSTSTTSATATTKDSSRKGK